MKVYTIQNGAVNEGAEISKFHLSGGTEIPAIVVGETGRGRAQGVLAVTNPPMMPCPNRFIKYQAGPDTKSAFKGNDPGPKPTIVSVCPLCGLSYSPWELYNFNEGSGQGWRSSHPADQGQVFGSLQFATVGESHSGKPKLVAAQAADEQDEAIIVFRTQIGYRGGNSHTGDRNGIYKVGSDSSLDWYKSGLTYKEALAYCQEGGIVTDNIYPAGYLTFPGKTLVEGTIAEGTAGYMGSGSQLVVTMPKGVVFRTGYYGRLYGGPSAHYYLFDGGRILSATWDERVTADLF